MSELTGDSETPVTSDDINAFASSLSAWGESLSPAEQALAQVLLAYTRDLRPEDVRRQQLVINLNDATRGAIASVKERWNRTAQGREAWVKTGPVWQKANPREGYEEWEIVQWTYTRPETWTPPYE